MGRLKACPKTMEKILLVQYGPGKDSVSKYIGQKLVQKIKGYEIQHVDLAKDIPPLFDEEKMDIYVRRNYRKEEVSEAEHRVMKEMDKYKNQFLEADYLVLITPMYNFGVPAAVKAWMDSVAQAKEVFRYTEYGAEGLSKIKKAFLVVVSGSTIKDSSRDFLTGHIKVYLEFLGIKNLDILGVFGSKFMGDGKYNKADEVIVELQSSFSK